MKKIRLVLVFLLSALMLFSFAACGETGTPENSSSAVPAKQVSAADAAAAIMGTVTLPEMIEGNTRVLSSYYDLDESLLADYAVYLTSSGATADEVAVFILNADADGAEIEAKLNQRISDQITSFTGYVDSQIARLNQAKISHIGSVYYLICTDDPTAGETALKNLIG